MGFRKWLQTWVFLFFVLTALGQLRGQSPAPSPTPTPSQTRDLGFAKRIVRDQKAMWLSPFHMDRDDLKVVFPLTAATIGLIVTDRRTSGFVDRFGSLPGASRGVSLGGTVYSTAGTAGAFYLVGRMTRNDHARKTGELAAEALVDTGIVTEVLKATIRRERPNADNGRGLLFKGGSSFPSGHSSSSWAAATVIAYQYKNRPLVKYGAFVAAALISMSRYSGRNHFLSDILVGGAVGFGIGRYVYKHQ